MGKEWKQWKSAWKQWKQIRQHEWERPNITVIDMKLTRTPLKEDCAAHLQDLKWTASSGFISASESSLVQNHILPEAACLWWGCEGSTISSQDDSHGQYLLSVPHHVGWCFMWSLLYSLIASSCFSQEVTLHKYFTPQTQPQPLPSENPMCNSRIKLSTTEDIEVINYRIHNK